MSDSDVHRDSHFPTQQKWPPQQSSYLQSERVDCERSSNVSMRDGMLSYCARTEGDGDELRRVPNTSEDEDEVKAPLSGDDPLYRRERSDDDIGPPNGSLRELKEFSCRAVGVRTFSPE